MFQTLFSLRLLLLLGVVCRVTVDGVWRCPAHKLGNAGSTTAKAYQIEALNIHNQYRAKHGSPPLTMDSTLNALAEQCAVYYAQKGAVDHSCPYSQDAGENLTGSLGVWSQTQMGSMSANGWYNKEVNRYDYNNPAFSYPGVGDTGHFTQVVWKSSRKFGYASTTINGFTAGVGLYLPQGNYADELSKNVLPPN